MNEAVLHELAGKVGGRFRLTTIVQKRLADLMRNRDDIIVKNCGGRPIRLVVEELAREILQLAAPKDGEKTKESPGPAGKEAR